MSSDSEAQNETQAPISSSENLAKIIDNVQSVIGLFLAIGAFITAAGVVIINVHLAKFTDIHGFSVSSTQFLPAGISLFIMLILTMFAFIPLKYSYDYIVRGDSKQHSRWQRALFIIWSIILFVLYVVFPAIIAATIPNSQYLIIITLIFLFILWYQENNLKRLIQHPFTGSSIILMSIFLLYAVLGGVTYAIVVYGNIPRYLGGGQAASAILVFKDADTLNQFGFSADPVQNTHTQNIVLLADLTDGILVLDRNSGQVAAVKNDLILGMIDEKVNAQYVITPTTTSTVTPVATITATVATSP